MKTNRKLLVAVIVLLIVIVAVVIVVIAHGNGKSKTTDTMKGMNMSTSNATSSGSNATTNEVAIENFAFSPANITVKVGTTVTWTNKDSTQHTVTIDSGAGPHSQPLAQGDTYSFTFSKAGTYSYHCSIHPTMQAKVVVTE